MEVWAALSVAAQGITRAGSAQPVRCNSSAHQLASSLHATKSLQGACLS